MVRFLCTASSPLHPKVPVAPRPFLPSIWKRVCDSANDTFEPGVSTKSPTAPVACGYGREVLADGVVPVESTVRLRETQRETEEGKVGKK
ncbi:hypothetical protein EYF80_008951 [Liparis tanakae]|uniref:Uncharacterized protein n=1 Tax=Liparis tanakae TaxID=230148 RepID=A0A4Z2ISW9_9TELE|nr:hypothetical protein EYF80_008951 [Liparis tanakae]